MLCELNELVEKAPPPNSGDDPSGGRQLSSECREDMQELLKTAPDPQITIDKREAGRQSVAQIKDAVETEVGPRPPTGEDLDADERRPAPESETGPPMERAPSDGVLTLEEQVSVAHLAVNKARDILAKKPITHASFADSAVITETGQMPQLNLMYPPESAVLHVLEGLQGSVVHELCRRSILPGVELGLNAVDGARVVTHNLTTNTDMNGARGTVLSFDSERGRYNVTLDSDPYIVFQLRPENLVEEPGTFASDATARLMEQLSHLNPNTRCLAVEAIGRMGETKSTLALAVRDRLRDADPHVRQAACEALGCMGEIGAAPADSVAMSLSDEDVFVRWSAIEALSKMGPSAVVHCDAVAARLLDDDIGVMVASIRCLATMGSAGGVYAQAVAMKVGSDNPKLMVAAIEALGQMGEHGADHIEIVLDRLHDSDRDVKVASINAIACFGAIGAAHADRIAEKLQDCSLEVIKDPEASSGTGVRLEDPDAPVREAALHALTRFGGHSEIYAKEASIKLADTDPRVRTAAIEFLVNLHYTGEALREVLHEAMQHRDPSVRRGALEVVKRSGEDGAQYAQEVAARLDDAHPEIRLAAVDVITAMGPAGEYHTPYAEGIKHEIWQARVKESLLELDKANHYMIKSRLKGPVVPVTQAKDASPPQNPTRAPTLFEKAIQKRLGHIDHAHGDVMELWHHATWGGDEPHSHLGHTRLPPSLRPVDSPRNMHPETQKARHRDKVSVGLSGDAI